MPHLALVLAPFFVHLELLFSLGYRKDFHKDLKNDIGKEVTRIRKAEGDRKRAAQAAKKDL
jgi:2-hydroxy fatty acid dioxygenase